MSFNDTMTHQQCLINIHYRTEPSPDMHYNKYCTNCGKSGHPPSHCKYPVLSYGIIALRIEYNPPPGMPIMFRILLIRRKDSISFVEFIRGKYNVIDREYIGRLCMNMTHAEHNMLRISTFEQLWTHVWGNSSKIYKRDFISSNSKFNSIRPHIVNILDEYPTQWIYPEWGFPKGRRNYRETDLNCAMREFEEETNINNSQYVLLCNPPLDETYYGSNNVRYCHKYYIAHCKGNIHVQLCPTNHHMINEVGNIGWFTEEEAADKLQYRNHPEKMEILRQVCIIGEDLCISRQ